MKLFTYIIISIVAISIIAGFFILGTPQEERSRRFDVQRINDLQAIQYQVVNYWQTKEKLPEKLTDLEDPISGFRSPVDPQTSQNYIYEIKNKLSFSLCANFSQAQTIEQPTTGLTDAKIPSPPIQPAAVATPSPQKLGVEWNWEHKAGVTCFERTIDPAQFPPLSKKS